MKIQETELPGVFLIEPRVFEDSRGFFTELYHERKFSSAGINVSFVQDNFSRSKRGVLRGLHYQIEHSQAKLVRCAAGEIFDVAIDLRKNSPHFGRWFGARLSGENMHQLYIPAGFAHGFCTLSETADVVYKCSELYHPEHERTLIWNDPDVGIEWPISEPVLSDKDRQGLPLKEAPCYESM